MAVTETRKILADQGRVQVDLQDGLGRKQSISMNLLDDLTPQELLLAAIKAQMEAEEAIIAANIAAMQP